MDDETSYAHKYRNIDFRKHPEKYIVGKGEQGVLIAEPYKSEILPFWKFASPEEAAESAQKIFDLFLQYKAKKDFVGMDMARKYLQMGFTRSRRYANHPSGKKYDPQGHVLPPVDSADTSPKAQSARIFYRFYRKAHDDDIYQQLLEHHLITQDT